MITQKEYNKQYKIKNKEKIKESMKIYRQKKKIEISQQRKDKYERYPWKRTLINIKSRCNNKNHPRYKDYGGRGIECNITEEELKFLWFRDKAYLLNQPSIDRKDNDGNYELSNCKYIEKSENTIKSNKERKRGKNENCFSPN